jgi:hypothetical protein
MEIFGWKCIDSECAKSKAIGVKRLKYRILSPVPETLVYVSTYLLSTSSPPESHRDRKGSDH